MTVSRSAYLWLLDEKKKLAEEGYKEIMASYEQLKARLLSILTFSITLSSACYTGAATGGTYSPLCLLMALGFTGTAFLCGLGLYPTPVRTKNVKTDALDIVLNVEPAVESKEDTYKRLTYFIETTSLENARSLSKDRRYLKRAWQVLIGTPFVSFLLVCMGRLVIWIVYWEGWA
ncbi:MULTISPECIES: hypothetical protein [unclassified Saccharibacter]|uniref:hypothetical protein n=1 Tax=unclassified Saccharibacter TaxID=2648722 RepID=UPI00132A1E21|nr:MULTISPECIES: hypothetical protein [unclassified Saccharibacter]MXV35848.1 hypothetical protein [Saccharibacter sp. EH611]MXV57969.1 hypothetical protein [Saccharibacter sp. EH70]MXV66364.1 hypothetical protein [Saccharibacter sp. EH60]